MIEQMLFDGFPDPVPGQQIPDLLSPRCKTRVLGEPVVVTGVLERKSLVFKRVWKPKSLSAPQPGILVGIRNRSNGDVDPGSWEEPTIYTSKERFTTYLVATHLRRKPVVVGVDQIIWKEGNNDSTTIGA